MDDLEDFGTVISAEPDFAYSQKVADIIIKNRRLLDNQLFVDRLLKTLGGDSGDSFSNLNFFQLSFTIFAALHLYPPRSNADLRNLYSLIARSSSPDHHKQSLIYYVIKDLKSKKHDPASFAAHFNLPSKYQTFVDGIWALDRMDLEVGHPLLLYANAEEIEKAVECLTEPALVPTFPEEILYTICKHCKDDVQLPLAYYHSAMPPVISLSKTLDALFNVMCQASLTEAFYFSRTYDELTRCHMFQSLLAFVHRSSGGNVRATRSLELIGLPFDRDEERWFEEFYVDGGGKNVHRSKDTIIMRSIIMGRALETVELGERMNERKIDGLSWTR
ncbi:MAG: hypothetical protein MMC23_005322 [Stictis urceolatum]|nr:hypothetical protein [Stictis urceolata]